MLTLFALLLLYLFQFTIPVLINYLLLEVATNSHILIIIEIMHYKPNNTTKLASENYR